MAALHREDDHYEVAPTWDDLVERKTWVEWKVLRQYMSIYNEALVTMRPSTKVPALSAPGCGKSA